LRAAAARRRRSFYPLRSDRPRRTRVWLLLDCFSHPLLRLLSKSKGNPVQMVGKFTPQGVKDLKKLSELTPVPQAAYLRQALDDLLKKYAATPCAALECEPSSKVMF
jgi:hypothetical protein